MEIIKNELAREVMDNLSCNILPFWMEKCIDPKGGFYGRIDGEGILHKNAVKGAILNARILWTFSAAFRVTGNKQYLEMAERAKDYIEKYFLDKEYGGVFWSLNADGTPHDTKKQFYALGFTIYGMSEFSRATGDISAKQIATDLFSLIEKYSYDGILGGYLEATTRDWRTIEDMRLSEKDDNAAKTMNTHLHILEPYTNLLRISPDNDKLKEAVRQLINLFLDTIEDPKSHHLGLFFDENWKRRDKEISYGHDIEASWLLLEAAQVLRDKDILDKTLSHTVNIAMAALEGRCHDGSMVYERHADGHYDNDKHWWVQAENVIGQLYLWKYHGRDDMLAKAAESWEFIKKNIVDEKNGEWYWSRKGNTINFTDDKAGFWKCPYHNSRMCLEAYELLKD